MLGATMRATGSPTCPESKRRRNVGQKFRRERATKLTQQMMLVDAGRRVWQELSNSGEPRADGLNATAEPTDSPGQRHIGSAEKIGGGLHAPGRMRHGYAGLNSVEQVRQSGSKKVRQQAEGAMPLGTIPARNAQPRRRYPWIAAMTGKRTSSLRVQWASRQADCPPLMVPDVHLGA